LTIAGGMTSTLHAHLETKHGDIYPSLRDQLQLKHSKRDLAASGSSAPEAFTMNGFEERLAKFIVANDQVSNSRESM